VVLLPAPGAAEGSKLVKNIKLLCPGPEDDISSLRPVTLNKATPQQLEDIVIGAGGIGLVQLEHYGQKATYDLPTDMVLQDNTTYVVIRLGSLLQDRDTEEVHFASHDVLRNTATGCLAATAPKPYISVQHSIKRTPLWLKRASSLPQVRGARMGRCSYSSCKVMV
jgi:hypothetical protein